MEQSSNATLPTIVAGAVAGIAAAAVWVFLILRTGSLFSVFAPVIGLAVGMAMRTTATRRSDASWSESAARKLGGAASLVTLVAIAGGKIAFLWGLYERNFDQPATWEAIRSPFFTSFIGIRGLYLLVALVAAFALVASIARTSRDD